MPFLMTDYAEGAKAAMAAKYAPELAQQQVEAGRLGIEAKQFELGQAKQAAEEQAKFSEEAAKILGGQVQGGLPGSANEPIKNMGDELKKNTQEHSQFAQQKQQLVQLSQAAAKAHNPALAMKLLEQSAGLGEKETEARSKALKLESDLTEFGGRLASRYLASPTNEVWYDVVKEALKNGVPGAESLLQVPNDPALRKQLAEGFVEQARGSKTQAQMEIAANKQAGLEKWREMKTEDLKQRRILEDRKITSLENYREWQKSHKTSAADPAYKEALSAIRLEATQLNKDRTNKEDEKKQLLRQKSDIESMRVILPEAERAHRLMQINEQLGSVVEEIDSINDKIATNSKEAKELGAPKIEAAKGKAPTPTKAAPTPKLTPESTTWFAKAKVANPGMSDEDILAEGRKLGKIKEVK